MADIAELGYRIDSRDALTAERNLNRMGRSTQNVTRLLGGFAVALGAAFSFNAAISQARRLDAAIGELSTLIPGATQQLDEMTRASREFGATFGTGTQAQASAFYAAVSAGATNAADAIARVDAANRLAIGGVATLESSIAILNTATNAYAASNLSAADAADVLFTGVRTGVTTIPELSAALGRAIPAAVAVGVEFDELVGAVSALTTQGQNTNIAVTSLTAALSQLTNPSQQAREIAQQLGIEFNATAVEAMGLVGFMENLVEATDGNQETMAQLFGSVEALRAVFSLAGEGGERFADIMGEMEGRAGAADAAFGTMAERLSTRWNVVMATAGERAEALGLVLLRVIVPTLEFVVNSFGMIAVSVGTFTAALLANRAVALLNVPAMQAIAASISMVGVRATAATVAVSALRAAIAVMLGPIGLAITLATAAATAVFMLGRRQEEAERRALAVAEAQERHNDALEVAQGLIDDFQPEIGIEGSQTFAQGLNILSDYRDGLNGVTTAARAAKIEAVNAQQAIVAELRTALELQQAQLDLFNSEAASVLFGTRSAQIRAIREANEEARILSRGLAIAQAALDDLFNTPVSEFGPQAGEIERAAQAVSDVVASLNERLLITSQENELQREIVSTLLQAGLALDDQSEAAMNIRNIVTQIYNIEQGRRAAIEAENTALEQQAEALRKIKDEREQAFILTQREQEARTRDVEGRLGMVTGDLDKEFTDPLQALRDEMLERQNILQEAMELELITREEYQARIAQTEQSYANARTDMMLSAGESMFGSLSELARNYAGEQSGIFKALFLAEQAFALSRAIINAQVALSQAAAAAPPPANIPLIAMAAAQTLPPIATIAAQTIAGLHSGGSVFVGGQGGTDNNMMSINGQPVARVERGERIDVVPRSRQSANDNGQEVRVNNELRLINETGVPMQMQWVTRDEVRLIVAEDAPRAAARSLNDPSSEMSAAVTSNTSARRVR